LAILPSSITMWCDSTPRAASWKPQLTAESGTVKSFQLFVRPACTSFIARSRLCSAISAE
jgi:hypothetical protein